MSWKGQTPMSLRREFVSFAAADGANVAAVCRRFGVSRKTGYKWLARHAAGGDAALADRPRRPLTSPARSAPAAEALVVALRAEHPAWGARKLKRRLEDLGHAGVPGRGAVHAALRRNGLVTPAASAAATAHVRFERPRPNDLWQMDFKGHFPTAAGRCHPLTVLDDHSRFNLVLRACGDERLGTVWDALADAFRRYGMPDAILSDNGPPWGAGGADGNWTTLAARLLRRGVRVLHGRPLHPQTQGKEERFHRTLAAEAVGARAFAGLADAQARFDAWRAVYNHDRPHGSLGLAVPAARYAPSPRAFPEAPPAVEYGDGDAVRRVCGRGCVSYRGRPWRVGKAFAGEPVAVRPTAADGVMDVYYCHQRVAELDLRAQGGHE